MKVQRLVLIGVSLLIPYSSAAFNQSNEAPSSHQFHQHSDGDLDLVQCQHTFYRVDQNGGKPELVSGQESRSNPSRQYLPPVPNKSSDPPIEEAPAASFDQPSLFSVEKTLVSPNLQKSYNSLFGKSFKPELSPAAAQNVPANALAPVVPKTINKITSDDDDPKYSLERLCSDAFHSFLCKPITGPRRTPNGRLRPNAVLPPEILSGLSSSQDVTRVKPDNIKARVFSPASPLLPNQPNQQVQRITFPPYPTTSKPTNRPSPAPFTKSYSPEIPSLTNLNPQVISPEPSNEVPYQTAPQKNGYSYEKPPIPFPPQETNPSNQNEQFIPTSPTPKPIQGYSYEKPRVPFPSNNIPQIAQPPHDCSRHENGIPPVVANPSNESPFFVKPTTNLGTNNLSTQKSYHFSTFSTTNSPRYAQPNTTPKPIQPHDCSSYKVSVNPFISNPTNRNPYYTRPTSNPQTTVYEPRKVAQPTINVAQIVAQPQQINIVKTPPNQQGYFYQKPSIPFPPPVGNPSNNNPSFALKPTQRPFTSQTTTLKPTSGYLYNQPKIPFPSNNIEQIISSQQAAVTTTVAPATPCQHEKLAFPLVYSPTNQNPVALRPDQTSNGYVYDKPKTPFPPEVVKPSNQDFTRLRPFVPTTTKPTTGYFYNKPSNPLILPNQNNQNIQNSIKPANNAYNYQQKPNTQSQTGFYTNSNAGLQNSFSAISSTQPPPFDAITTAGYAYNKPKGPYPSSINDKLSEPTEEKLSFIPKHHTQVGHPYEDKSRISTQASNQYHQFKGYPLSKHTNPYGR